MTDQKARMAEAKARFEEGTKEHRIADIFEQPGQFRRVVVRNPKHGFHHFTLTTWHNHLAITGDIGCFIFSRVPDMFTFFRISDDGGRINPGYWSEKVVAADPRVPVEEFDAETLRASLIDMYACDPGDEERDIKQAKLAQALQAVEYIPDGSPTGQHEAIEALTSIGVSDAQEVGCMEFTHTFLEILHAIVLGIKLYDEAKSAQVVATA